MPDATDEWVVETRFGSLRVLSHVPVLGEALAEDGQIDVQIGTSTQKIQACLTAAVISFKRLAISFRAIRAAMIGQDGRLCARHA